MNFHGRILPSGLLFLSTVSLAMAQTSTSGDPGHGKILFQQNCAVCHADILGEGNSAITRQGPSLVGVFGRRAGAGPNFNYTQPLKESGLTWNVSTLDRFLSNPSAMVPGTTMALLIS